MQQLVREHSRVLDVTADELLEAVEALAPTGGMVVIVHIYDPSVPVCSIINHRLDVLSAQPAHQRRAKFLRIRSNQLPGALGEANAAQGFDGVM